MKLKQILSGFMAVAMAVTSSVVMTATVGAESIVLEQNGTHTFVTKTEGDGSISVDATVFNISGSSYNFTKDDIITATITADEGSDTSGWKIAFVGYNTSWGGWSPNICSDSGALTFSSTIGDIMDANSIDDFTTFGGVNLQVWGPTEGEVIDYSLTVTTEGTVTAVVFEEWVDNQDGTYTYRTDADPDTTDNNWNGVANSLDIDDFSVLLPVGETVSDIRRIVVTPTKSGGSVGGAIGTTLQLTEDPWYEWTSVSTSYDSVVVIDAPNGLTDTATLKLQIDWINFGTAITVDVELLTASMANTITIDENIENGDVSVSAEEAVEGTEITLTATPDKGYELDAYTVTDASDNTVTVTDGKFTMPDSAVTVSATFKAIDYTLTAATADGGSIYFEVDGNRAETANVGDAVYVIIEADDYYNLSSATANGVPVEACLFTMPAEDVTVTPVFALDTETLKTDVDAALVTVISSTQSSAYTVANLNTAIVNALAKINEAVALTVDTSKLTLKASTEEATGSITGTVTIKAGNTTITTAAADVTLEKLPTDPVQVAYDAILAYLETVTFDNDFHATNQSKAIEALVAEKAPDARVSPSFTVILATYTDAGSVKGTIQIIADGYEAKTITVDEVITVLAKTDEMLLEEAVTATEAAIKDITTADGITVAVIEEAIANDDITVTVKSEETKAPTTTATGVQTVTITLTLNELSKTVTKTFDIDKLEEEESIVLWSGSTDLGTDWGTSITVTFDTSKLNAGDTVKVTYKAGTAATYQQIKLMNGDWTVLESPTGMNEWDAIDLSATETTYEFVISEADVKLLNGTMIVSGYNATISSVEVIPAKNETSSSYTDPENTDIPTGKIVTQKTVVKDGIYNQRFIKKVSASELVGATKIVFTVSNGTKTAKYESTKCYSSLNVNGGSLSAGDDYVFLGLTIKGIPENITVTIEDIEIV